MKKVVKLIQKQEEEGEDGWIVEDITVEEDDITITQEEEDGDGGGIRKNKRTFVTM